MRHRPSSSIRNADERHIGGLASGYSRIGDMETAMPYFEQYLAARPYVPLFTAECCSRCITNPTLPATASG